MRLRAMDAFDNLIVFGRGFPVSFSVTKTQYSLCVILSTLRPAGESSVSTSLGRCLPFLTRLLGRFLRSCFFLRLSEKCYDVSINETRR